MFGDVVGALANPLKELKDPDNLLEKLLRLLWVAEDLLEAVDCDHRFRFPTPPSRSPLPLSGLVCRALDRLLLASGVNVRRERSVGIVFASVGLCDLRPDTGGCGPCREVKDEARCTVTIEEDDAEFGREPCRW